MESQSMFLPIYIVRTITSGFCDFIAQCIIVSIYHCRYHPFNYSPKPLKIYRCWIVWGQNIRVVIIPSFMAIAYLGQSIYYLRLRLISRFQFIASSYLDIDRWRSNTCTRPAFGCLGDHGDSIKFFFVHGRECPGDGFDRVQDPQGIPGS